MDKQKELEYEATVGLSNETCVAMVENRYDLVLIGARRARELARGDMPRVGGQRRSHIVTALKEIEAGKVTRDYLYKEQDLTPQKRRRT